MNGNGFAKAIKTRKKLRLAIIGPAGSGKTFTALAIGCTLGKRVAVIDTEHGSASAYADLHGYDVLELSTYSPLEYVKALKLAADAGYDVVIVDSLSHAWIGKGGALDQVDQAAARSKTGNSFGAWREVTPQHNALVEALITSPCHVICTIRSKTAYVQEKDEKSGRTTIRKVGLEPVQRDGLEYEFDLVFDLDHEHRAVVTKSRIPALADAVISKPGADVANALSQWLEGAPAANKQMAGELLGPVTSAPAIAEGPATAAQFAKMKELHAQTKLGAAYWEETKKFYNVESAAKLSAAQANAVIGELERVIHEEGATNA